MPITFDKSSWRTSATSDYHQKRSEMIDRMRDTVASIQRQNVELDSLAKDLAKLDEAARVFGLPVPGDEFQHAPTPPPPPPPHIVSGPAVKQFRDVALDYLRRQYPNSVKAAEISAWAEKVLGRKYHEKTAGMTLYRFSLKGLAERIGHADWRYIPQKDEAQDRESQASIFDRQPNLSEG